MAKRRRRKQKNRNRAIGQNRPVQQRAPADGAQQPAPQAAPEPETLAQKPAPGSSAPTSEPPAADPSAPGADASAGQADSAMTAREPPTPAPATATSAMVEAQDKPGWAVTPYRPPAVTRAKTRMQLGDWEKLAELDGNEVIGGAPVTELQLMAAVGHLQKGGENARDRARALLLEAMDTGADRKQIARMLIAGASNTLGRLAALTGRSDQKVLEHFRSAISISDPEADVDLMLHPMAARQLGRLATDTGSKSLQEMAQRVAMSVAFAESDGAEETQPKKSNAAPAALAAPEQEAPPALSIPVQVTVDGVDYETRLVPNHSEACALSDGVLSYDLPGNTPCYLVTNAAGNFESAASFHRIPLKANTAYEISGAIPHGTEQHPAFWLFEYTGGKKVAAYSYPAQGERYAGHFRTGSKPEVVNLALRVAGTGQFPLLGWKFTLRSGTDVEIAETLSAQLSKLGGQLKETLTQHQDRHAKQSMAQLESFIRLQRYLGDDFMLPEMHGWVISPDFGVLLIQLLERTQYDAIVEFGSGVSTLIVARSLQKQQQRSVHQTVPFVSFDHLENYATQTRDQLRTAGVSEFATVECTPLQPMVVPGKGEFLYYNCQQSLRALAKNLTAQRPRVLILVDGPPAKTGPLARYPALHCLLEAMKPGVSLDFLLDDYIREDERKIAAAWEADLQRLGRTFTKEEFRKMEKQACLLSVDSQNP